MNRTNRKLLQIRSRNSLRKRGIDWKGDAKFTYHNGIYIEEISMVVFVKRGFMMKGKIEKRTE
jgi:hypothetical protein